MHYTEKTEMTPAERRIYEQMIAAVREALKWSEHDLALTPDEGVALAARVEFLRQALLPPNDR